MINNIIQEAQDLTHIFERVEKSFKENNHLYLVYDCTSKTIGITRDKSLATPLSTIQQSIKACHPDLSSHPALRNVTRHYFSKHQGFIAFLLRRCFPNKREEYEKMLPFAKCVSFKADQLLGERQHGVSETAELTTSERILKSFPQELTEKQILLQREMHEELIQRKKAALENLEITPDEWLHAIIIDFSSHFNVECQAQYLAVLAVKEAVQFVLDDWIEKLEAGKNHMEVENFLESVVHNMKRMNKISLELDQALFRDLMGNKVYDGKGEPVESLPLDHPTIKRFIDRYQSARWDNKVYTLNYEQIPDAKMMEKVNKVLNLIFTTEGTALLSLSNLLTDLKKDI